MVMQAPSSEDTNAAAFGTLRQRVEPHLPEIESRAKETEKARAVPTENIDIIRDAGFVRSFVPRERGGDERDLWDYVDGVRAVSKACPSTGWVTGVLNVHPVLIQHYPEKIRDQVWAGGPDTIIASSGSPIMKAQLADGGVRLTGEGQWSSGSNHAEYVLVGLKVPDIADGNNPYRKWRQMMFMAHKDEYTIKDVWHTEAMRGTASNNLVFDDLFIEWDRLESLDAITFGYSRGVTESNNWLSHIPLSSIFSVFFPAVALGCADGMIEEFKKRAKTRKNAYTGAAGIVNPAGHMRLAESVHEIEAITAYYKQQMEEMQEYGMRRDKFTEDRFHNMNARLAYVTDRAVEVVERLFIGSGSSAIAAGGKLSRYWRDAHACRLHTGMDYDTSRLVHGRNLLGLMPTPDL